MKTRLIIDGNAVYEIDEECLECRKKKGERISEEKRKPESGRDGNQGRQKKTD